MEEIFEESKVESQKLTLKDNPFPLTTTDNPNRIPEISLHAMMGAMNLKTTWMMARIANYPLVVLIDTRSTHNFLDVNAMHMIKLKCDTNEKTGVKVANGALVIGEGKINWVSFSIQV